MTETNQANTRMRTTQISCAALCLIAVLCHCCSGNGSEAFLPPTAELERLDLSNPELWRPQVSWLANPDVQARAELADGGLRFAVPTPLKGMKWSYSLPAVDICEQRFLLVRYRARNLNTNTSDYFVHLDDGTAKQFNAIRLNELVPDGQWRLAVAYLPSRTEARAVSKVAAIQVQATVDGDAQLVITDLVLTDCVAERLLGPNLRAEIDRFEAQPVEGFRLDTGTVQGWNQQTAWFPRELAGTATVRADGGITVFSVEGPAGSRMKWSHVLPVAVDTHAFRYVTARYKASNLGSTNDYALYIGGSVGGAHGTGAVVLSSGDIDADDGWRTDASRGPQR